MKEWTKALEHLAYMKRVAEELPNGTGIFYIMSCKQLEDRYFMNERTKELYDEIMKLR